MVRRRGAALGPAGSFRRAAPPPPTDKRRRRKHASTHSLILFSRGGFHHHSRPEDNSFTHSISSIVAPSHGVSPRSRALEVVLDGIERPASGARAPRQGRAGHGGALYGMGSLSHHSRQVLVVGRRAPHERLRGGLQGRLGAGPQAAAAADGGGRDSFGDSGPGRRVLLLGARAGRILSDYGTLLLLPFSRLTADAGSSGGGGGR